MKSYEQLEVDIEGVLIPIIVKEGTEYYPLSIIEQKLLIRPKGSLVSSFKSNQKFKFQVDFSLIGGGVQNNVNCIEREVLAERLKRTQHRRLITSQKKQQNKLHRYLGIEELDIGEYEWDKFQVKWLKEHDFYTKGIIERLIKDSRDIKSRKCVTCGLVFPLMDNFFYKEGTGSISHVCKRCARKNGEYTSDDTYEEYLKRRDIELIKPYRFNDVIKIYEAYRKRVISTLPEGFFTRDNLKLIVLHLSKIGLICRKNLNNERLIELRLYIKKYNVNEIHEIYSWIYGNNFYMEKWKYPKYKFSKSVDISKEDVVQIFTNYVKNNNIAIDNPFLYNYKKTLRDCGIETVKNILFNGMCEFFVDYWKGKYAGYQYRNVGNYYKKDDNFLSDLRFLVEKDICLQVEKIPLYITLGLLHREYKNIYNFIKLDGRSLFYWFNILYPDKFIESDFTIGRYRNEFDSMEEQQVDDVLREYFPNVIYNYNSSDQTVELKGKRPDWFILTEKGVWIVEYLGMYLEKQIKNPIIKRYIDSTHNKLELYNELEGYNLLLVYPSDIEKDFLGLRDKLLKIRRETI